MIVIKDSKNVDSKHCKQCTFYREKNIRFVRNQIPKIVHSFNTICIFLI